MFIKTNIMGKDELIRPTVLNTKNILSVNGLECIVDYIPAFIQENSEAYSVCEMRGGKVILISRAFLPENFPGFIPYLEKDGEKGLLNPAIITFISEEPNGDVMIGMEHGESFVTLSSVDELSSFLIKE